MKIKASELRKSLKEKGLDEADVELLVKAKVDADEAEDDETSPDDDTDIDVGQIDAFAKAFAKSRETPLTGGTSDALNKSTGEPGELLQLLETFAAAQDETLGRLDDNHTILGEGLLAVGETTKGLVKAFGDIRRNQTEIKVLMSEVRDRLGEPIPPRAVDTSDLGEGGGGDGGNLAKSARAVQRAAIDEMKRSDTTRDRRDELGRAVERIEKGENPDQVAKAAKINV